MSEISAAYNAVTYLLDRNIDEGRADKLAYADTISELTYRELQRQSCRVANMLRRLGVRREERVAMIMLDTVDFPSVFLGAMRAGIVPVPLNTLLTADQYAYVLADCRARVLFISEALLPTVKDMLGRMGDLEHVVVAGRDRTRRCERACAGKRSGGGRLAADAVRADDGACELLHQITVFVASFRRDDDTDRVWTVLLSDIAQPLRHVPECFVPGRFAEAAALADERAL